MQIIHSEKDNRRTFTEAPDDETTEDSVVETPSLKLSDLKFEPNFTDKSVAIKITLPQSKEELIKVFKYPKDSSSTLNGVDEETTTTKSVETETETTEDNIVSQPEGIFKPTNMSPESIWALQKADKKIVGTEISRIINIPAAEIMKWKYPPASHHEAVAKFLELDPWYLRPDLYDWDVTEDNEETTNEELNVDDDNGSTNETVIEELANNSELELSSVETKSETKPKSATTTKSKSKTKTDTKLNADKSGGKVTTNLGTDPKEIWLNLKKEINVTALSKFLGRSRDSVKNWKQVHPDYVGKVAEYIGKEPKDLRPDLVE